MFSVRPSVFTGQGGDVWAAAASFVCCLLYALEPKGRQVGQGCNTKCFFSALQQTLHFILEHADIFLM